MQIYEYAHLSSITFLVTFLAAPRHLLISSPEVQLRNPALERQQLRNAHLLMNMDMDLFFLSNDITLHSDYIVCIVWYIEYSWVWTHN